MFKRSSLLITLLFATASTLLAAPPAPAQKDLAQQSAGSGMMVGIDPATGEIRPLTAAEAQELSRSFMESLIIRPLVATMTSSGATSVILDDSFLNFYVARMTEGGVLDFQCVNHPEDAVTLLKTAAVPSIMRRVPVSPALEEK